MARSYIEQGDLDSARSLMGARKKRSARGTEMQNSSTEFRTDGGSFASSVSAM